MIKINLRQLKCILFSGFKNKSVTYNSEILNLANAFSETKLKYIKNITIAT